MNACLASCCVQLSQQPSGLPEGGGAVLICSRTPEFAGEVLPSRRPCRKRLADLSIAARWTAACSFTYDGSAVRWTLAPTTSLRIQGRHTGQSETARGDYSYRLIRLVA